MLQDFLVALCDHDFPRAKVILGTHHSEIEQMGTDDPNRTLLMQLIDPQWEQLVRHELWEHFAHKYIRVNQLKGKHMFGKFNLFSHMVGLWENLEEENIVGKTILFKACKLRHKALLHVKTLVTHGAKVDHMDRDNRTCLFDATHHSVIQYLYDECGVNVNHVDRFGNTVLIYAIKRKPVLTVETLLRLGADPNYPSSLKNSLWKLISRNVPVTHYMKRLHLLFTYGARLTVHHVEFLLDEERKKEIVMICLGDHDKHLSPELQMRLFLFAHRVGHRKVGKHMSRRMGLRKIMWDHPKFKWYKRNIVKKRILLKSWLESHPKIIQSGLFDPRWTRSLQKYI